MRTASAALAILLSLAGSAGAETYGLKAARTALSGKSQAVIIGVPAQFFRADRVTASADSQTAGDWSYYFGEWMGRYRDRTNVVVVDDREIKQLFKAPALEKTCATVFVRDPGHALVYDADCAPKTAIYDAGAAWTQTGATPDPKLGLRAVEVKLR